MTHEEDHEEWKKRAPYQLHEPGSFKPRYEGSCNCGAVKFQLNREKPLDAKLCHCTTCQTLHAAPFQWAAIFHKTDINFVNGHHDLTWYDPSEKSVRHKLPCKVTCKWCSSNIMDEGRNMILLYPTLIHFKSAEERNNFEPIVIDINDGKPKWSGLDQKSELMEEAPLKKGKSEKKSA